MITSIEKSKRKMQKNMQKKMILNIMNALQNMVLIFLKYLMKLLLCLLGDIKRHIKVKGILFALKKKTIKKVEVSVIFKYLNYK